MILYLKDIGKNLEKYIRSPVYSHSLLYIILETFFHFLEKDICFFFGIKTESVHQCLDKIKPYLLVFLEWKLEQYVYVLVKEFFICFIAYLFKLLELLSLDL